MYETCTNSTRYLHFPENMSVERAHAKLVAMLLGRCDQECRQVVAKFCSFMDTGFRYVALLAIIVILTMISNICVFATDMMIT